jgi:isoprenylcysteine carboxyl methyltransferase (ICMT) family protein YpbQ
MKFSKAYKNYQVEIRGELIFIQMLWHAYTNTQMYIYIHIYIYIHTERKITVNMIQSMVDCFIIQRFVGWKLSPQVFGFKDLRLWFQSQL